MATDIDDEARRLKAFVPTDNAFQRLARVRQARWRERRELPVGEHRGTPLGSRLEMPYAGETLANYLTDTIRDVVRAEVLDKAKSAGKLYGQPRIFNDLLSSQPLCFNVFGELQRDLDLATRVISSLTDGHVARVTAIEFEHSPGRRDAKYTGDRSAFDVFIEYVAVGGARGFLGVEVKYHEDLGDSPAEHRERYDEVAAAMGAFRPDALSKLREKPLQQIWRDHLLVGSLVADADAGYAEGRFVFLSPAENTRCRDAVVAYRACLSGEATFTAWTVEQVVAALRAATSAPWVDELAGRYLGD
jgi:hypothetical protein